jgi:branched-chain amino acid transport system ATP-binding protein
MLLKISQFFGAYDGADVLHGIDLAVEEATMTVMLGMNGAGKSSLLKGIMGQLPRSRGEVRFKGQSILGWKTDKISRAGIAWVPEGRALFPELTVKDHLRIASFSRRDKAAAAADLQWIWNIFPRLSDRKRQPAGTLSGGEQQLLALARTFMQKADLVLLDEPTLGLSPHWIQEIFRIIPQFLIRGSSLCLIETRIYQALGAADQICFLEEGKLKMTGPPQEILPLIDQPFLPS